MDALTKYKTLMIDHLIARAENRDNDEDRIADELDELWREMTDTERAAASNWVDANILGHLHKDGSIKDVESLRKERSEAKLP